MKKFILLLVFIFFGVVAPVHAQFYPRDAITKTIQLLGASSYTFEAGTSAKTVLGASIQQSVTSSNTNLQCGSNNIMLNYAKDTAFNAMQYRCFDTLSVSKTGNDNAFIILTYVNRDVATQSAVFGNTVDIATSSALWGGLYATNGAIFVIGWIVAIGVGWYVGTWLYKR